MKILLGTKNKHKIIEMTRILQEAFKDSELIILDKASHFSYIEKSGM